MFCLTDPLLRFPSLKKVIGKNSLGSAPSERGCGIPALGQRHGSVRGYAGCGWIAVVVDHSGIGALGADLVELVETLEPLAFRRLVGPQRAAEAKAVLLGAAGVLDRNHTAVVPVSGEMGGGSLFWLD